MRDPRAIFNRLAVIGFPVIILAACSISLLASGLDGGWSRAIYLAWDFSHGRALPMVGFAGAGIGLSDWAFPAKRKTLFVAAIIFGLLTAYLGHALAALIRGL